MSLIVEILHCRRGVVTVVIVAKVEKWKNNGNSRRRCISSPLIVVVWILV